MAEREVVRLRMEHTLLLEFSHEIDLTLPSRNNWKGLSITDEQLIEVAIAYNRIIWFGTRKPTQILADLTGVPRSTVARWVGLARKKGMVGDISTYKNRKLKSMTVLDSDHA